MRIFLPALALLVAMHTPAQAADTPLALADEVYAPYLGGMVEVDFAKIVSAELQRLRDAEVARIENGEEPSFQFDPMLGAPGGEITDFKAELLPESNEYAATIAVSFQNLGKPIALELLAFNYDGDWRLEDVTSRMPGMEYMLTDLLSPRIVFSDETFADPGRVAEALYTPYVEPGFNWRRWDQSQLLSSGLNALYARDAAESEARQEVGRIDFDPFVNGQDFDVTDLTFGPAEVSGETAEVVVRFANFETPQTVTLSLVAEAGRWKIDDAANDNADYPYRLRDILEAPLPEWAAAE